MTSFYEKYIKDGKLLPKTEYDKKLKISIKTTSNSQLDARQLLILQPIVEFYSNQRNMYILINILNGSSIVSLRLIEYFVVNYVLKNKLRFNFKKYDSKPEFLVKNINDISYKLNEEELENNYENIIIVHDNYKSQLKQYNKKNFDPFCRSKRIKLYYDISENNSQYYFDTTVAQLNFFKWAISNYIIDYIIDNLETIENAMSVYEKKIKMNKKTKKSATTGKANSPPSARKTKSKFVKINKTTMKLNCPRVIKFD